MIRETAPAKVNLFLRVGPRRDDGLHEICSLFTALELADELRLVEAERDSVHCPGVAGPNLASAALATFRRAGAPELPPLRIEIDKRVPVAAGLGGGSADAAAVLRAANTLVGAPLGADELRALGAELGADVPSQVEPGSAVVTGAGERVEPVALAPLELVLVPQRPGLSTAAVYREADRLGCVGSTLDPAEARALSTAPLDRLARTLVNDLEPAALSLRPELEEALDALRQEGALAARITGSGPTAFGLFADRRGAERAVAALPGSVRTATRANVAPPAPEVGG